MHPLDPLLPGEIAHAAKIVRDRFSNATAFRVITLAEPPKATLLAYLERIASSDGEDARPVSRIARVLVYLGRIYHEMLVDLDAGKIIAVEKLDGRHSHIDPVYMEQVGDACLADKRVQAEIEALELPDGAIVVVEPWAYATDGMSDMSQRTTMCYFYMRLTHHGDANYYAFPLDLCAEVSDELVVRKIYRLPVSEDGRIDSSRKPFDRRKIHTSSEYHPDLVKQHRTSTQSLHVSQPTGPSFKVNGYHIEWENWSLRIGFNYREGLTLHDVRFNGRPLFYRLSLSEMFVPYGDPRVPYPRKAAFDIGNDGAGVNANTLSLGCDCLGHIRYFDGWHVASDGSPVRLPNVICCHELDDGILWKHTNFRTGNAVVARSRILALQTVVTVSNYEYVFAFLLGQDAELTYEVRATGILSTVPIDYGTHAPGIGTVVAPGVLAPVHQHLFCLRIDPNIDGQRNTLFIEETHPVPVPTSSTSSAPYDIAGIAFLTTSIPVEHECGFDLDHTSHRTFKIANESITNPTTGTPIAYKLVPHYSQTLLAHPSTFHAKRSEFAAHAVWVTRCADEELYAAGTYTMQSSGGEGIAAWIARRQEKGNTGVKDEDIVVWHTFGSTHVPRIEDWPVMPCEKMRVSLKPVNFFGGNPAIDVAPSRQEVNKSVLVD